MSKYLPSAVRPCFLAALACLLAPAAMHAANTGTFTLTTPTITALPGTSATFELSFAESVLSSNVTAFSLTLDATSAVATGLTFTAATMDTTDPYIFAGISSDVANNTAFSSTAFPNTQFEFQDKATNLAGATAATNTTYGLAEVFYTVAPDALPGVYTLTTTGTVTQTGNPTVTMLPGTLTIVPEPGAAVWCGAGAAGLLGWLARRRARAALKP